MKHLPVIHVVETLVLLSLTGCAATHYTPDDEARTRMLSLLMPSRIEIVAPFTRVKSFDDDNTPDGIELLLQAVNSLDDPGMIVGSVRVELFEHVPASGDAKGRRLEFWDVELDSIKQQLTYWNKATQMYEFLLQVEPEVIPTASRFVLHVTYNSPLGERLTTEHTFDYSSARQSRSTFRR